MVEWVQFAVKIREYGIRDEDLIKHYFEVPRSLAKKVNENHDCLAPEEKLVEFSLYQRDPNIRFIKGRLGSIEITTSRVEDARSTIDSLFSGEYKFPKNFESFFS